MENIKSKTIGEIVAQDYRAAAVFKKYGIDFCCNGNRTIEVASTQKELDPAKTEQEVLQVLSSPRNGAEGSAIDFKSWPSDLLADYVEKKHHRYVEAQIPVLNAYLDKLCKVHGDRHPELFEITTLFGQCAGELAAHMKKEELMLFPFIRKMVQAKQSGNNISAPFGTVQNPIGAMMHDHDQEGERFRKISALSGQYTPPPDACNTYRVTYALLKEFEEDLHLHIHLENNILFPSAIALESALAA